MSIIDKSREELAAERRQHEIDVVVAFDAMGILPHVANGSTLDPFFVVERAFAIARIMDDRLRTLGIERVMQQGVVDTRIVR